MKFLMDMKIFRKSKMKLHAGSKLISFALICIIATLVGCSDINTLGDCRQEFMEKFKMVPFTGEDPGCKNTLSEYDLFGKKFIALGNHCADVIFVPIDCEGKKLNRPGNFAEQTLFDRFAKDKGIFAVDK